MGASGVVLLSLMIAVLVLHDNADAAEQRLRLHPGGQTKVQLQENPSTGYKWQIDRANSSNLALVRIADDGFARNERATGKRLVGAPGIHRWTIEALSLGNARISFIYLRSWERAPVRRHELVVQVAPP
jgi:inhibitor of cysteine peptidase